jgi:formylmethanofuran dehydrogenase subunit E
VSAARSPTVHAFLAGTFLRELEAVRARRAAGDLVDCSHCGADCDADSADRYGEPLCNACAEDL